MKKLVLISAALFMAGLTFAQKANVSKIVPQGMLIDDEKNPTKYSVLNLIDKKSSTVFAMENSKIKSDKPFVSFYFSDKTTVDSIKIQHGFFDSKLFQSNNRISQIKVVKKLTDYNDQEIVYEKTFSLQDQMKEQVLTLNKDSCNAIELYVVNVVKGSKYDDTVIGEVTFCNGGKNLSTDFVEGGDCAPAESEYTVTSENNRMVKEYYNYYMDRSIPTTIYHTRDERGNLIFSFTDEMEQKTYKLYHFDYENSGDNKTVTTATYAMNPQGEPISTAVLTYKNGLLMSEKTSTNWVTEYTYDGKKLVKKVEYRIAEPNKTFDAKKIKTEPKDAKKIGALADKNMHGKNIGKENMKTIEYFYDGNNLVSEKVSTGDDVTIYGYKYNGNQATLKTVVYSTNAGLYKTTFFEYEPNVVRQITFTYKGVSLNRK